MTVAKMSLPKDSRTYWSNPPLSIFLHSGTLAFTTEHQSA